MNPFKLIWLWLDFCTLYGGGKGGGNTAAAQAQSQASQEIALQGNYANRPTINTPFGSQTWDTSKGVDPSTGQAVTQWETNINLTPEQQAALDSQQRIQQGRSDAAETLLGQATSAFQTPFDWNNLTQVSDVGGAQQNAYQTMSAMLEPGREQQRQSQRTRLANMGLAENDEAARRAQAGLADQFATQDKSMMAQALGEGRSQVELEQKQRQNQIAEQIQRRGMTLNELNALLTGQQVGMPNMPQAPAALTGQAPDLLGAKQADSAGGVNWGQLAGTAAIVGASMM